MQAIDRAHMRDWIRRRLNIQPPQDYPPTSPRYGPPGAQPLGQPNPNNALLNDIIDETVAEVYLRADLGSPPQPVSIALQPQTENGPMAISLEGDQWQGIDAAFEFTRVRDAWWDDGSGVAQPMYSRSFDYVTRNQWGYQNYAPGVPQWWWTQGYFLYILPAPSTTGTLLARAGVGLMAPLTDADNLAQLPAQLYPRFLIVATEIASGTQADRVYNETRLAVYTPKAEEALDKIAEWLADVNSLNTTGVFYQTHRRITTGRSR